MTTLERCTCMHVCNKIKLINSKRNMSMGELLFQFNSRLTETYQVSSQSIFAFNIPKEILVPQEGPLLLMAPWEGP